MTYELALAQARLGHDVQVFTGFPSSQIPEMAIRSGDAPPIIRSFRMTESTAASRSLYTALRAHAGGVDAIHGHSVFLPLNRYVGAIAKHFGVPTFFHVHGALDAAWIRTAFVKRLKKSLYIRCVERPLLNAAAAIFALTEQEREQIAAAGITAPVVVLPNGIVPVRRATPEEVRSFRNRHRIGAGVPVILSLTRLDAKKAVDVLVEAFARLPGQPISPVLVIAGNPASSPAYAHLLRDIARRNGIEDRVIWTGHLSEVEKVGAFGAATLCSHVSYSEGMALSILESMSAGVPTIISNHCNMNEAVAHGAVALSRCDPDELANVISGLLGTPAAIREMGHRAGAFVKSHHDWTSIAGRVASSYQVFGRRSAKEV